MQVLAFSIIIPIIFSFHNKIQFYKKWPMFIKANILVTIPFLIWDELFTRYGVWGFTNKHIIGVYLFSLPIEEILFFIITKLATWPSGRSRGCRTGGRHLVEVALPLRRRHALPVRLRLFLLHRAPLLNLL